jgi:acetamidase/formamidase
MEAWKPMTLRSARIVLWTLAAAAALPVAPRAETHRFEPKRHFFTYCHAHPPQLRIAPGDTVVTTTRDAANDVYTTEDRTVSPKIDLDAVNPQTGPFFVEGAQPGDTLVVNIEQVTPNRDWGWGASIPFFGALAPEYKTAMLTPTAPDRLFIWKFDRERKAASLDLPGSRVKKVEVPLAPFLGTIGVAPPGKECIASITPGAHGGNMDYKGIVPGTTLYLPVFEPGALLMVGDGHAAQGDGEMAGAAIETSMDVRFRVDLIKGRAIAWPRLDDGASIMSIGSTRPLIDAVRLACVDLVGWMVQEHGFETWEAAQLLGQAAQIDIAQIVDPSYTAVCGIAKSHLSR